MNNQNLQFNIIPFDWPEEEVTFYFHREGQADHYRLHQKLFPYQLDCIFPGVKCSGAEYVATSFDRPTEGFMPLDIDLQYDNAELARRYFHYKVHRYFQSLGNMVVRNGFSKGVQVWVPAFRSHTAERLVYECFRLQVQLGTVSSMPELLIRYEREMRVSRQSVAQMIEHVPPSLFQWLLVGNRLVKYEDYVQEENVDFGSALPVLNQEIRKVLRMLGPGLNEDNPYKKHFKYIHGFYRKFLDNDHFREVLLIHQEFLHVGPELVRCLPYTVQEQPFEVGRGLVGVRTGLASNAGFPALKPYKISLHAQIHLFFVVHRKDARLIETVKQYFFKGVGQFKGVSKYAQLNLHPQKDMDIIFEHLDNPLIEIGKVLNDHRRWQQAGITYIAVYISPYNQQDPDPWKRVIYHHVKHMLLERGIPMQVLDAEKLYGAKGAYEQYLPGIAVAMLAKLGGIPWRMRVPVRNEMVAGVGTFRKKGNDACYMAVGLSFSNEGRFFGFNCFWEHELEMVAGCISYGARKYSEEFGYPKRLVIHINRKQGNMELALLERTLKALTFPKPLPIFIVSMYGVVSEDFIAFDTGWGGLMPYSGTIVRVGVHEYLLFNNIRYGGGCFDGGDGLVEGDDFTLPIKVRVDCTDKELLNDEEGVMELLGQVHQFSRMNWRGLRQQGLPVTVRYAELVARMVAHFPEGRLPVEGERGMWFL